MDEHEPFEPEGSSGLTRRDLLVVGGSATAALLALPSLAAARVQRGFAVPPGQSPLEDRILKFERTTVDTSKWKKTGPYTLGFVNQGPFNGWGKMYNVAAQYTANKSGMVKKIISVDSNGDPNKQINDMQDVIAQKPDLILLTPMSKAALSAPVERAMRAGIPVVVSGSSVNTDNFVAEVGRNLYEVAYENAVAFAKRLGGKGNVIVFNGIAGTDTAIQWRQAALDAFKKYPGIKVIADQFANWSIADSKKDAAAILAANSQIDGVWTGGSEMSLGTILAFLEAKRKLPLFGTTNPLNGFLRLAKKHHIKFVGSPYPPAMSAEAVKTVLDVLQGKPVKKYRDIAPVMLKGQVTYTEKDIAKHYKPQYNDDYIDPTPVPAADLKKAGFGA